MRGAGVSVLQQPPASTGNTDAAKANACGAFGAQPAAPASRSSKRTQRDKTKQANPSITLIPCQTGQLFYTEGHKRGHAAPIHASRACVPTVTLQEHTVQCCCVLLLTSAAAPSHFRRAYSALLLCAVAHLCSCALSTARSLPATPPCLQSAAACRKESICCCRDSPDLMLATTWRAQVAQQAQQMCGISAIVCKGAASTAGKGGRASTA
jgi:hypothetical protein